jgi:transcriptional regulator with XRE-family HTH domain
MIRNLRLERGLSQEEVCRRCHIGRSSYIAFEQGKVELSFSQTAQLANLFGLSLEQVESGLRPNYDKYKQMILAYLRCHPSSDGKVVKTKLAKLLYLADFAWFYEHLESMSGMQYRRLPYGPVPDQYFRAIDELQESGQISLDHKSDISLISETDSSKKQALTELSKDELSLIKKICQKWKSKKSTEIVHFIHNQLPYKICQPDEIIPYELITQEDPGYVY